MYRPLILFMWGGLLLPHGLDGSWASSTGNSSETNQFPTISSYAPGPTLLSSVLPKSFQSHLPQKGVSCKDLMPDALEDFATRPLLSQIFIQAALALALQAGGCTQHAESLALHLYRQLGKEDAEALLFVMARSPGMGNASGPSKSRAAALQFNLEQLASMQAPHCKGLTHIQGYALHGQVHSVHKGILAAATVCQQLGGSCAGVATNRTGLYHVLKRDGSYFLPHYGAHSWLHQCHKVARNQRSAPENCMSEREKKVHGIVQWIPGIDAYYNFGTGIYYATQSCMDLAKERALEGVMDLGISALVAAVPGGPIARVALEPAVKAAVRAFISYWNQPEELHPIPTDHSGPVTII